MGKAGSFNVMGYNRANEIIVTMLAVAGSRRPSAGLPAHNCTSLNTNTGGWCCPGHGCSTDYPTNLLTNPRTNQQPNATSDGNGYTIGNAFSYANGNGNAIANSLAHAYRSL